MQTDTLVDPDTVMVEFLHAVSTHGAVFRARWFLEKASSTLNTFLKDDSIELEAFEGGDNGAPIGIFVQLAWIDPACHEVAPIAHKHQHSAVS